MSTDAAPSVRHYQFVTPITGAAHEAYALVGIEDQLFELALDTDYCIIVKVGNTGDMNATGDFQLQVQIDGGGFNNVDATSSNIRTTGTGDIDDATSVTERLSTSAETFTGSVLDEGDGIITTACPGHQEFEHYYAFNVRSAELSATGHLLEFRLLRVGATFPHDLQLFAKTPAPMPAYTPVPTFKQRFRRQQQQLPQHDEWAQISVTPITPADFERVLKANRTSFKRVLQQAPPVTPQGPTTRVTHLTAGVLFNQAPPTVRVTQLTVAVLYGNFESQSVPELDLRKAFRSSFERTIQALAHNPDYPPTPAGFFDGFWPGSKAVESFNVSFDRQFLPVLELDQYPVTPVPVVSVVAETPALKATLIEFERQLQKLPQHDEFPPTPAGFFDGQWPASLTLRPFTTDFRRILQKLPQLDEYPPTPPAFFEGFFPAPFRVKRIAITYHRIALRVLDPHVYPPTPLGFFEGQWPSHKPPPTLRVSFEREIQPVLNPHVYPATPPGFFDGFWPGSKAVESIRSSFDRTIQTLGIPPVYPATPVSAEDYAGLTPVLKANRISFTREIQSVELDERPPTPPRFFEGFFPAAIRLKRIPITYGREAQVPLELYERPPTPPGFFDGHWPAPVPPPTLKSSFKREIQPVLNPHVYPATPAGFFDGFWPGSKAVESFRSSFDRTIQSVELDEYPPTPFGFFDGFWPGSKAVESFRSSFDRTIQSVELDEYPITPTVPISVVAETPVLKANQTSFKRVLQQPPPVTPRGLTTRVTHLTAAALYNQAPPTVRVTQLTVAVLYGNFESQSVPELDLRKAFRSSFERQLQHLPHPEDTPATPPPPISVVAETPALKANLTDFKRTLQTPLEIDEYPVTPPVPISVVAETPALKATLIEFERQLQKLPQLDEHPPTPLGFFDGFWPGSKAVESLHSSFEAEIQPVLNPHVYPPTPLGFFDGFWPASKPFPTFRSSFKRIIQAVLIPPVYPPTPVSAENYPALTPVLRSKRIEFTRALQTLELNEYPPTPPPISVVAETPALKANRVSFKRALQTLPHPESSPKTQISVVAETPALKANRIDFKRTLQTIAEINEYPFIPSTIVPYTAYTPTIKANRSTFERQRQRLPQHDQWTQTPKFAPTTAVNPALKAISSKFNRELQRLPIPPFPAAIPAPTAFAPVPKSNRISFDRTRQELPRHPTYRPTPPGFYEGMWPGSARVNANKVSFERQPQQLPPLDEYPETPLGFFAGQYTSTVLLRPFKVEFNRTRQDVDHNALYPETPAVFVNYPSIFRVDSIHRRDTHREQQTVLHNIYPPTPPGFYEGFYPATAPLKQANKTDFTRRRILLAPKHEFPPPIPGLFAAFWPSFKAVETYRISFRRTLQTPAELDERPETPLGFFSGQYTSTVLLRPFKVDFTRTLQPIPRAPDRPPTPPAVIEMPAMFAVPTIRRRDTHRTLQDLAQVPSKEGFRILSPECRWFADCFDVSWLADIAPTVWKADLKEGWEADCD
jgi:hypothetical protein